MLVRARHALGLISFVSLIDFGIIYLLRVHLLHNALAFLLLCLVVDPLGPIEVVVGARLRSLRRTMESFVKYFVLRENLLQFILQTVDVVVWARTLLVVVETVLHSHGRTVVGS